MLKMNHRFRSAVLPKPGDVLLDRSGREMIVLEIVDKNSGDCYALYNGEVKLVNALKSSVVVPPIKEEAIKEETINDRR
jgi:hypothetical protein